ncbi:MAG TPA: glycosyltransferase [Solirubrobacteraceae bacterium]|nr:glycosyltransferase [Solirubrobacteraceae bacterium]
MAAGSVVAASVVAPSGASVTAASATAGGDECAPIAVVGVSTRPTCGVRDHARLLADELARDGVPCSWHWLSRSERSLREARAEVGAWADALAAELEGAPPRAILWHYSAFAYSHRGVPLFVAPTLGALRSAGVPVIAFMHELVYPWGRGGLRGATWALTQRGVLIEVVRASSAGVVTADFRAQWLASRPWLARRPVAVVPVFSNLPSSRAAPNPDRAAPLLGLFGYSLDPASIVLVADALHVLWGRGVQARLALLGAPGPSSGIAEVWREAATERGIEQALSFSGALPAQQLADALAGCDLLLYADRMGPAARKGTLAAALASGRALVAMEGRRRWPEFLRSDAACVVQRTPAAFAGAIAALLGDARARELLGARGRAFYERTMSVARSAATVRELLAEHAMTGAQVPAPRSERQLERVRL